MIHVCMTASLRAETVRRTVDSFRELVNVGPHHVEWLINIDPAGEGDVADVIACFDGLNATFNLPGKANLNEALRWCYRAADAPLFYFTEDDVEYRARFDLAAAIDEFPKHDRLGYLAVPRTPFPANDRAGIRNGPTVGRITWRDGGYKMCLGPGLLSSEYARGCAGRMADYPDPELQFHMRNPDLTRWVNSWRFATFGAMDPQAFETPEGRFGWPVWDIGRPYREQKGYRWVDTPEGTVWQRV